LWSITYRRIKIDENGKGHIFAIRGFDKEFFIGAALCIFISNVGVDMAIRLKAMSRRYLYSLAKVDVAELVDFG
jgi:hypothetical protein